MLSSFAHAERASLVPVLLKEQCKSANGTNTPVNLALLSVCIGQKTLTQTYLSIVCETIMFLFARNETTIFEE